MYISKNHEKSCLEKGSYDRSKVVLGIFRDNFYHDKIENSIGKSIKHIEKDIDIDGNCYGIICFEGKYFRAEWSHSSYGGNDPYGIEDTIHEVIPVEETVVVYKSKC